MFSFNSVALLSFLLHSLLLCLPVCALPHHLRQAGDPTRTASKVSTAVSPDGTIITSCQYVFTPVKNDKGEDRVREVITCVLILNGSSSIESLPTTSSSISTTTATLPPTISTSSSSSPTPTPTPSPPDAVGGSFSSTTESIPTTSTIPPPGTTSTPPERIPDTPTTSTPPEGIPTSTTPPPGTLTSSTPEGVSGIAAAAESAMPGKKLAVLPIGLGVFAGISVIALIVVGIVTYERTKYRKVFRKHKLAEEGAQMGYGGMVY